jgi:hypothetical protein
VRLQPIVREQHGFEDLDLSFTNHHEFRRNDRNLSVAEFEESVP